MTIYSISKKNILSVIIGLLSSAFFGYLVLKDFDWGVLRKVILTLDLFPILLACISQLFVFALRAVRWKYFLPRNSKFTYKSRFSGVALGYFFGSFMPMRLGDLIRPAYLAKVNRRSFKVCLFSVILERYYEAIAIFIIALILFKFVAIPQMEMLSIDLSLLFFGALLGVLLLFFARPILLMTTLICRKLKLSFVVSKLNEVLKAFEINFKMQHITFLLCFTAAIIFFDGLVFVFVLKSLLMKISFFGCIVVMLVATLSNFLPSAPGGIGVYHYFCQLGLIVFGIGDERALSAAVVIHAFFFVFQMILGLFCLVLGPLKVGDIINRRQLKTQQTKDVGFMIEKANSKC